MAPEEELSPEEKLLRVIQKGKTPPAPDAAPKDGDDAVLGATQKLVSLPIRSEPPKKAVKVAGRPAAVQHGERRS